MGIAFTPYQKGKVFHLQVDSVHIGWCVAPGPLAVYARIRLSPLWGANLVRERVALTTNRWLFILVMVPSFRRMTIRVSAFGALVKLEMLS